MSDAQGRKRSQRVQLACVPCRSGKLKCNRDFPVCDQCYKRSREGSCTYTERGLRYNAARHKAESMREKIDRLETFVTHLKDGRVAGNRSVLDANARTAVVPDISSRGSGELAGGYVEVERELSPMTGNLRLSDSGSTHYVRRPATAHMRVLADVLQC